MQEHVADAGNIGHHLLSSYDLCHFWLVESLFQYPGLIDDLANAALSVFGMTNMPQNDSFKSFGIVFAVTCVPTYMLIGSLNTTSGLQFWSSKTNQFLTWIGNSFAAFLALFGFKPKWTNAYHAKLSNPAGTFEGHSHPLASLAYLTNLADQC